MKPFWLKVAASQRDIAHIANAQTVDNMSGLHALPGHATISPALVVETAKLRDLPVFKRRYCLPVHLYHEPASGCRTRWRYSPWTGMKYLGLTSSSMCR